MRSKQLIKWKSEQSPTQVLMQVNATKSLTIFGLFYSAFYLFSCSFAIASSKQHYIAVDKHIQYTPHGLHIAQYTGIAATMIADRRLYIFFIVHKFSSNRQRPTAGALQPMTNVSSPEMRWQGRKFFQRILARMWRRLHKYTVIYLCALFEHTDC